MSPCDCSNCKPEEAEALWLAQSALTTDNFDGALAMCESQLFDLANSLPERPPPPAPQTRSLAMRCKADDPIRSSPLHKSLVNMFESSFERFFNTIFTGPSDLGPADYFSRELAWGLAKNVDELSSPKGFAAVLTSEMIPGQYQCHLEAFNEWKDAYDTADIIAVARYSRLATLKPAAKIEPPQSVEGAVISHARELADKEQSRFERDQAKLQDAEDKQAERYRIAKEKEETKKAKAVAKAEKARIAKDNKEAKKAAALAKAAEKARIAKEKGQLPKPKPRPPAKTRARKVVPPAGTATTEHLSGISKPGGLKDVVQEPHQKGSLTQQTWSAARPKEPRLMTCWSPRIPSVGCPCR
ncbi:uncharacterized protein MELLADRAFT_112723 [Melampsora larici-populina 98AG31]|uniref:Uncharacterized protein n=1 Tax=Melampsora larici-populina (strain 98AG31 / pathotype 3-4-7) TaxID=747676 RepID=F4S7D7_MELLP|nr:uncharacterized protein MELLADRAFT_112723 [Melampsora larici-populina 98AG31]EGF99388.1 hypothetical protein MELLADRAFT_112723 [Melampsora larici-populina 98AG31]